MSADGHHDGASSRSGPLTAGHIGRLRGLPRVRVGDRLGDPDDAPVRVHFSPPILESVVRPRHPGREGELHAALTELADEDPLIRTRTIAGGATSVLLYGAVQQEVIAERLAREFAVDAVFEHARPVYFERPVGRGEALHEFAPRGPNEFWQTLGVRIEPNPAGTGISYVNAAELGMLPKGYHRAIEDAAMAAMQQGLHGWEVTDCRITITQVGWHAPRTAAADFRRLTPLVLLQAFALAGSAVHEPGCAVQVEVPDDTLGGVVGLLTSLGADVGPVVTASSVAGLVVPARIPARLLRDLAVAIPGLTHGEGAIWSEPGADRRVRGVPPTRERFDGIPLDHDRYLRLSNPALGATGRS